MGFTPRKINRGDRKAIWPKFTAELQWSRPVSQRVTHDSAVYDMEYIRKEKDGDVSRRAQKMTAMTFTWQVYSYLLKSWVPVKSYQFSCVDDFSTVGYFVPVHTVHVFTHSLAGTHAVILVNVLLFVLISNNCGDRGVRRWLCTGVLN